VVNTVQPRPIRLKPDNFTPPSRTPWGGTRLVQRYKARLDLGALDPTAPVGESWELSTCDEFHTVTESGELLGQWLAREPRALLGDEALLGGRLTALLVKWLDAADNLSLQIHPEDDYRHLGPDESGKVEAWYVVDHDPGAGIYLGFRPGVTERQVQEALAADEDLSTLMAFSLVERGDFVLLEPGTPHALGKGISLLEPQVVAPGKRAMTYRYWDWRRRYDARGQRDANGRPRELHVAHALAVTRWDRACDPAWLASRVQHRGWPALDGTAPALTPSGIAERVRGGASGTAGGARCEVLCTPEQGQGAGLYSSRLRVARLLGQGATRLPAWNALRALTVVEGEVKLGRGADALVLTAGETCAVPAVSGALDVELAAAHALVCAAAG
jgi:mannose-6-phosphate isomerase class I